MSCQQGSQKGEGCQRGNFSWNNICANITFAQIKLLPKTNTAPQYWKRKVTGENTKSALTWHIWQFWFWLDMSSPARKTPAPTSADAAPHFHIEQISILWLYGNEHWAMQNGNIFQLQVQILWAQFQDFRYMKCMFCEWMNEKARKILWYLGQGQVGGDNLSMMMNPWVVFISGQYYTLNCEIESTPH